MQVSIIIINYNTFELTCKCIQSIYDKTTTISFEIILVDNASIECDAILFKQQYPEITLVKSEKNIGFAGGNNLGILHSNGEYILLLNSDTELLNNAIELSYNRLKGEKNIVGLSSQLLNEDGSIQHPAGKFLYISSLILKISGICRLYSKSKREERFLGFDFDHTREIKADWLWGTFLFLRKSIINEMPNNELPNNFFMYCEDVEWGYAINKLGCELIYFPDAKIIHHGGKSGHENINRTIHKNLYTVLKKYRSATYANIYFSLSNILQVITTTRNKVKSRF
ncbi:MAG TPA: glycosyltransferase family 2 protein [Ferruginibacter sp.]|nr:glycosyltransferase family 2 protein [Ferruginibacter sp.]